MIELGFKACGCCDQADCWITGRPAMDNTTVPSGSAQACGALGLGLRLLPATAAKFEVSVSFVVKLMQRRRQHGTDQYGGWKRSPLVAHTDQVLALMDAMPDRPSRSCVAVSRGAASGPAAPADQWRCPIACCWRR
jgi:hypothetical protein